MQPEWRAEKCVMSPARLRNQAKSPVTPENKMATSKGANTYNRQNWEDSVC